MNTKLNFSKEDITFNGTENEKKLKEELFDSSLLIAKRDKEIERLNAELELLKDNKILLNVQLNQNLNIIKEVREFAKLRKEMYERQENIIGQEVITSLFEILDEENK